MDLNNNRQTPSARRKRSSGKVTVVKGMFSVRLSNGSFHKDAEGVKESMAWEIFLHYHDAAELLRGTIVVAWRHDMPAIQQKELI